MNEKEVCVECGALSACWSCWLCGEEVRLCRNHIGEAIVTERSTGQQIRAHVHVKRNGRAAHHGKTFAIRLL